MKYTRFAGALCALLLLIPLPTVAEDALAQQALSEENAGLAVLSEAEARLLYPIVGSEPAEQDTDAADAFTDEELAAYTTLTVGSRSNDVLRLKRRLYETGYYTKPNETQLYTESTAEVIERVQADFGLPVTGEADPLTQAVLFSGQARPTPTPAPVYLENAEAPLYIQRAEITSYSFYGSVQLSLRNQTGKKLTAFGLKIIPYMRDGTPADMAETFEEEIERSWSVKDISIAADSSYSDFATNDLFDEGVWPHHFQVSRKIYFTGAQLAVSWYRSGGSNVYVDDDQMVFISAGDGAQSALMRSLPIEVTAAEAANAGWEIGFVTRYVLPVYQVQYSLPQGAYIMSIENGSPADQAGLQSGDVVVGIGDVTILGDATLRKARGQMQPGESASLCFWRDGVYYITTLTRPEK